MNRIDQAIEFAAKAHVGQARKGTKIPYISHPFAVALILQQAGCNENVIIAGLLHDTLEDTETTEDDIQSQFGEEVLRLVIGASEPDKSASWEERKQHTLEFLKTADLDVLMSDPSGAPTNCIISVLFAGTWTWMETQYGANLTKAMTNSDGTIQGLLKVWVTLHASLY